MAKFTFKVRNAKLVRVADMWPKYEGTEQGDRNVLVCVSDGMCPIRGIPDNWPIRTSMIEKISEDRTKVETMNSIYEISSWEE